MQPGEETASDDIPMKYLCPYGEHNNENRTIHTIRYHYITIGKHKDEICQYFQTKVGTNFIEAMIRIFGRIELFEGKRWNCRKTNLEDVMNCFSKMLPSENTPDIHDIHLKNVMRKMQRRT